MRPNFKKAIEIKRNRIKRHSGKIFQELLAAFTLLGAVLATAMMLILACNFLLSTGLFRVENINVAGCERLTEKNIIALAEINMNQNLLAISTALVSEKVKKSPWVADVSVSRSLPSTLSITVCEKKPVALIKKGNELFFIDRECAAIKKIENGEDSDLPVLTGFSENLQLIRKSIELIDFFSSFSEFPLARNVSEIYGDEVQGLSVVLENGPCLQLGFDDYTSKLKRFITIMADLGRKNISAGFLLIDLHDPSKTTVQRRFGQSIEKSQRKYRT